MGNKQGKSTQPETGTDHDHDEQTDHTHEDHEHNDHDGEGHDEQTDHTHEDHPHSHIVEGALEGFQAVQPLLTHGLQAGVNFVGHTIGGDHADPIVDLVNHAIGGLGQLATEGAMRADIHLRHRNMEDDAVRSIHPTIGHNAAVTFQYLAIATDIVRIFFLTAVHQGLSIPFTNFRIPQLTGWNETYADSRINTAAVATINALQVMISFFAYIFCAMAVPVNGVRHYFGEPEYVPHEPVHQTDTAVAALGQITDKMTHAAEKAGKDINTFMNDAANTIQAGFRGMLGRKKAKASVAEAAAAAKIAKAAREAANEQKDHEDDDIDHQEHEDIHTSSAISNAGGTVVAEEHKDHEDIHTSSAISNAGDTIVAGAEELQQQMTQAANKIKSAFKGMLNRKATKESVAEEVAAAKIAKAEREAANEQKDHEDDDIDHQHDEDPNQHQEVRHQVSPVDEETQTIGEIDLGHDHQHDVEGGGEHLHDHQEPQVVKHDHNHDHQHGIEGGDHIHDHPETHHSHNPLTMIANALHLGHPAPQVVDHTRDHQHEIDEHDHGHDHHDPSEGGMHHSHNPITMIANALHLGHPAPQAVDHAHDHQHEIDEHDHDHGHQHNNTHFLGLNIFGAHHVVTAADAPPPPPHNDTQQHFSLLHPFGHSSSASHVTILGGVSMTPSDALGKIGKFDPSHHDHGDGSI